jgi:hypothetical protein
MTDEAHRVAETYDRKQTTRQLMRATGITIPQQRTAASMDLVDVR